MRRAPENTSFAASVWRFLSSVHLTAVLLLLVAATSAIGTLIPQDGSPADYIRQYGEFGYRLLYVFDLLDMYHSWWFHGLIVLLTTNIVVCTWKRFPATWKTAVSGPLMPPARRSQGQGILEFKDSRDPDALKAAYEAYFRKRFQRLRIDPIESGFRIAAEKGRWTRLGVTGVHLSVVLLLAGALVGSLFGFDGYVNIPEGERVDRIRLRNSGEIVPLGFEIFCEDFDVSFYDTGAPREYRSRLHIVDEGRTVVQKDIIVNDPLRYKGINLFQSSYGSLPANALTLRFAPRNGGEPILRDIAAGRWVDLPGSEFRFYLKEIRSEYRLGGMDVGETALGMFERSDGESTEVVLPMKFPTYDKIRKGEWVISVADHAHAYYTGLQVTRDPAVPLVYAGFFLLIIGCWVTFFMAHQKIAVEVVQSSQSSRIRLYGSSNRNPVGFENRLKSAGHRARAAVQSV